MSTIRQDQLEVASAFMTAFWKEIVKPYYNPEQTDDWWDALIVHMEDFNEKYSKGDKRLQKMLIGFCNGLNEVYMDGRGQAE